MELDTRIAARIARGDDPSDEQFRLLVSSVTDCAICLLDPGGRVMSWNAGAERIKGYRPDEIIGRQFSLFFPVEDRVAGRPQQALAQAAAEGRFEGEGWRVRNDGSRFWAEVVITALRGKEGELKGFAQVTRDMTERHLAREREQLFAATFNQAPIGITVADASGRYIAANASFLALLGYGEDELLRMTIFDLTHPDDAAATQRSFEQVLSGAVERVELEKRYLRRDGRAVWTRLNVSRIVDAEGRVTRLVAQVEDIAERRAMEEQLREREARLHAFTSHSPSVMFLKRADGRYRFVNQRFLERYAVRREQVIGRTDAELFPQKLAHALARNDAEVIARGEPMQHEESGERISLVVKFPVFDAAGKATGVGGIETDVTELKRAEQALREQRTLLAEAQKIAGLGCWEWDPASGRLAWSDELYRIYGVTPESFQPSFENYLERVHPEDRQQVGTMVARVLMDGRDVEMQERVVRPGGEVRYLRSHGAVVRNAEGRPVKMFGACFDVTEQRHSEAALRQAAADLHALTRRLVQAEEAERRRIARELHDRVGQTLSALNIQLDIVLAQLEAPPELRQRLEDAVALVGRTLESIEGVMAELRPPLLDEYGLGDALTWHGEELAQRTGLKVAVADLAPDATKKLRPEAAAALFRIAQEALNNVVKHARASNVGIEISAGEDGVALEVRDDGKGFDAAAAPRGRLGMSTMRERAEAAGGRIELKSSPGAGTTVRARVPL